jgi:hypothetical protein
MGMLQGGLLGQAAPAGDTITLNNAHCEDADDTGSGASARIRLHNTAFATRQGECWVEINGTYTFDHDVIVPGSNVEDYEMKWETLSGDAPNDNVVAAGVWHPLSTSHFFVGWDVGGEGARAGSCTVSIRKGTGSVLDTGVWDGDVESVPPEKGK